MKRKTGSALLTGQLLHGRLDYVRETLGAPAVAALVASLPGPDRRALEELERGGWYPLDLLLRLDRAIAAAVAPGDPSVYERLGEASARRRTGWLGEHAGLVSVHAFLSGVADEHLHFQTFGRATYRRIAFHEAELAFSDYPPGVDPIWCQSAKGYLREAARILSGGEAEVDERTCQSRGERECAFRIRWKGRRRPPAPDHPPGRRGR